MGVTVAVIPARAGSKGIPGKNLLPFCGKPLVAWSIEQARMAAGVDSVWVSSDGDDILAVARAYGAHDIRRPDAISGDAASSESAWLDALDVIERQGHEVEWMVGMQATSPLRTPEDIGRAIQQAKDHRLDSLLSVVEIEDFFMWGMKDGEPFSVNYDYRERKPRQHIERRYLENGSFYVFRPEILRGLGNRLGGKIGLHVMERHKMFQIDNSEDVRICEAIMRGFELDRL